MGHRLRRAWRRLIHRRHRRYLRLDLAVDSLSRPNHLCNTSTAAKKLCEWGRLLVGRLPYFRLPGNHRKLLEEEEEEPQTPKGYTAVYVGGEKERYTVPVVYFNHPLFAELLREAEQESGFHHPGGITIPCPAAKFEQVRTRIATGAESLRRQTAACTASNF